jgi:hypothetical protein
LQLRLTKNLAERTEIGFELIQQNIASKSVAEFFKYVVSSEDAYQISMPFDYIDVSDLRHFLSVRNNTIKPIWFINDRSYDVCLRASRIFHTFNFSGFLDFASANSVESTAYDAIANLVESGVTTSFIVEDCEDSIDVLLKIYCSAWTKNLKVMINERVVARLGENKFGYYRSVFGCGVEVFSGDGTHLYESKSLLISDNSNTILDYIEKRNSKNFLLYCKRSVLDVFTISHNLRTKGIKLDVWQPDTNSSSMLALGLTSST